MVESYEALSGAVTSFALDRWSFLAARPAVPADVLDTVKVWQENGRPFYVEVDYHRPRRRLADGRRAPAPSVAQYGFQEPVSIPTPTWWVDALRRWKGGRRAVR